MSNLITWNQNDKTNGVVLTNNDLTVNAYGETQIARCSVPKDTGKFYVEIKVDTISQLSSTYIGISNGTVPVSMNFGTTPDAICYIPDGRIFSNNATIKTVSPYGAGDVIGLAIDYELKQVYVYKNSVNIGNFSYVITGQIFVFAGTGGLSPNSFTGTANFGTVPFNISTTHPETWEQLMVDGFLPYDEDNAIWIYKNKFLFQEGIDIQVYNDITSQWENVGTATDSLSTLFENYGMDNVPEVDFLDILSKKILIEKHSNADEPVIQLTAIPYPQLIIQNENIDIPALQHINTLILSTNITGDGIIKTVFSVNNGTTWKTYDAVTETFIDIDITNIDNVKNNGIDTVTFNNLGIKWNDIIKENKVKFAYYLGQENITDKAELSQLRINMDYTDSWIKAAHPTEYGYKFDNKGAYVTFNIDGTFKVNYIELLDAEGSEQNWEEF